MSALITLTCPNCGAKLKLSERANLLLCASCGNEHLVRREEGAISLEPLVEDVRQIRAATDKTNAELVIARLQRDIDQSKADLASFAAAVPKEPKEKVRRQVLLMFCIVMALIALIASKIPGFDGAGFLLCIVASLAIFGLLPRLLLRDHRKAKTAHEQEVKRRSSAIQQIQAEVQRQLPLVAG